MGVEELSIFDKSSIFNFHCYIVDFTSPEFGPPISSNKQRVISTNQTHCEKGSNFCRTIVFNEYFMIQQVSMCKNCAVFHISFMIRYSPNNYITTQQHQLTTYQTTENVVSH